ncbi:DUF2244 domain-containing protein [Cognatishimia sp.]|uniref:DUF2244 domain-containing protein n=1 Tax=Cognatishimia sp. TaxID=2211648 RepID=UPI00351829F4|nr:DUF2244 domain-containing protein [Cognatishimia sp.]
MPHHWSDTPEGPVVLTLTAHRSLPPKGFAAVILITVAFLTLPLLSVLGTAVLWWMLPFLAAAVWALWAALRRSYKDGEVSEELTRAGDVLTLTHRPVRGDEMVWESNIYWVRVELHKTGGPVSNYVTLKGNGRHVELGRFLSEDERQELFNEMQAYIAQSKTTTS